MVQIVGVRFKRNGKIYYFQPGNLKLAIEDAVIVETVRGIEFGSVVIGPREIDEQELANPLKEVVRKANAADLKKHAENQEAEKEAFLICCKKIEQHKLPIKLIEVTYNFDVSKITFYFTAEGRVDFRELVKDLATIFRTRIELRQIGVRDEAKVIGGLGTCGRELCCHSVLSEFYPVSIRMAKKQNLSLNPAKISGVCGRLMCCLKFENYDDDSCCCTKNKKKQKSCQKFDLDLEDPDLEGLDLHELEEGLLLEEED